MSKVLVEVSFKGGRPEPIVVDVTKKVLWAPGLNGGTAVVHNLRGDSRGFGKGMVTVRLKDVAGIKVVG